MVATPSRKPRSAKPFSMLNRGSCLRLHGARVLVMKPPRLQSALKIAFMTFQIAGPGPLPGMRQELPERSGHGWAGTQLAVSVSCRFLAYVLLSRAVPGPTGTAHFSWLGWRRPGSNRVAFFN